MRCVSGGQILGAKNSGPRQKHPRAGTSLRAAYDLFHANKGRPVEFQIGDFGTNRTTIVMLTDFYGMDIRCLRNGNSRVGRRSRWVFAGEWFGRIYVDYIADHVVNSPASSPEEAA